MAAGFPNSLSQLFLGDPKLFQKTTVAFRFLDRIQIFALQIFDKGRGHSVPVRQIAHEDRHFM